MKTILLLACYLLNNLSQSHAGTKLWTSEEQETASSLYAKYCFGSTDRGQDGHISWICKRPQRKAPKVESYIHVYEYRPLQQEKEQVIFIENPPNEYKHEVIVRGNVGAKQKTRIVVVPGRDTHSVQVKEEVTSDLDTQKPSILFLKDNINNGDSDQDTEASSYYQSNRQSFNYQNYQLPSNYRTSQNQDSVNNPVIPTQDSMTSPEISDNQGSSILDEYSMTPSFESIKVPKAPSFSRRITKSMRIHREKRNFGASTSKLIFSQPLTKGTVVEKKNEEMNVNVEESNNQRKSVVLHFRRKNPSRFGYVTQKSMSDEEDDFASSASSYYSYTPQTKVRPVYVRSQKSEI